MKLKRVICQRCFFMQLQYEKKRDEILSRTKLMTSKIYECGVVAPITVLRMNRFIGSITPPIDFSVDLKERGLSA